MTKERIEYMREAVLPFVKKKLLEIDYEGLGKSDAEEFEKDFNKILNMAVKTLEQECILNKIRAEIEQTRKIYLDMNDIDWLNGCDYVLSVIDKYKTESDG